MFALNSTRISKMNHQAKNIALLTSPFLGCDDSMMSSMSMIMR